MKVTENIEAAKVFDLQAEALEFAAKLAREALNLPVEDDARYYTFRPTVRLKGLKWVIAVVDNPFVREGKIGYVEAELKPVFPHKNEDYGDLMPLNEWWESVDCGCFTSWDGSGYFSNGTHHTYEGSVFERENIPAGATHVLWFNK